MREIKFRCCFYDGVDVSTGEMYSGGDAFCEDFIEWKNNTLKPTDKCTILMQYTGLKDKNGKEIYEGDVVNVSYKHSLSKPKPVHKGEIYYDETNAEFAIRNVYNSEGFSTKEFEVIGNIYENPELLENK